MHINHRPVGYKSITQIQNTEGYNFGIEYYLTTIYELVLWNLYSAPLNKFLDKNGEQFVSITCTKEVDEEALQWKILWALYLKIKQWTGSCWVWLPAWVTYYSPSCNKNSYISWMLSSWTFQLNNGAVMSLSSARSFLSEACYGEQELDANSALMELDKGTLAS